MSDLAALYFINASSIPVTHPVVLIGGDRLLLAKAPLMLSIGLIPD